MWEYDARDVPGPLDGALQWLAAQGEAGWEAFAVEPMTGGGGYRFWLKRRQGGVVGPLSHGNAAVSRSEP